MNVYRCARCAKKVEERIYLPHVEIYNFKRPDGTTDSSEYGVCLECLTLLKAWLEEKP